MTKEEWQTELKAAQDNLNNLVKEARNANNTVHLSVTIEKPMSTVSLVSVTVV